MQRSYLPSERDTTWPSSAETLQVGVFESLSAATEAANTVSNFALTMFRRRKRHTLEKFKK